MKNWILSKFKTKPNTLTSWIEAQEALEGIYHGVEGCNNPKHGHPINLTTKRK